MWVRENPLSPFGRGSRGAVTWFSATPENRTKSASSMGTSAAAELSPGNRSWSQLLACSVEKADPRRMLGAKFARLSETKVAQPSETKTPLETKIRQERPTTPRHQTYERGRARPQIPSAQSRKAEPIGSPKNSPSHQASRKGFRGGAHARPKATRLHHAARRRGGSWRARRGCFE
jgi:hypothetical protein